MSLKVKDSSTFKKLPAFRKREFEIRKFTYTQLQELGTNHKLQPFPYLFLVNIPFSQGDKLFEWVDGPLISAMKNGDMILLDEISLADDSVLERLNSVLEPERQITQAESSESLTLTAHHDFRVVATMNPGGDYGKKEV